MSYSAIDLSQLPSPEVVETLDYENILAEMLNDLRQRDSSFSALVESDPAYKILEVAAYRETIIRARVNDGAKAVMLAYATGKDLEHIGARYGVYRQLLTPADPDAIPPVEAVYEQDEELRRRIQLALEGLSVAGPQGAYIYHSLSADPRVQDVAATSPKPAEVLITVLSREGDGSASDDLVAAVNARLQKDNIRPLTDQVTVQSAEIVTYTVDAKLYTYAGPESSLVLAEAKKGLETYIGESSKLGEDVPLSGIFAALHVTGVQRVELVSPKTDVVIGLTQAAYCESITVTDQGTGF